MTARSIWKGAVNFGMVSIPAKLYGAVEDDRVNLHQYHQVCGSRISMPRFCPVCDRKLEAAEIVKGYELGDRFVPLTEADFQSLPLRSVKAIEVVEFIDPGQVDFRCWGKPYFLKADTAGDKAYKLMMLAMEETGLAAVGKFAYREREHLCLLRPFDGVVALQTLLYAEQLRPYEEFRPKDYAVSDREIELAVALVEAMANPVFEHGKYHDEYRQALERLIEAKAAGEVIEMPKVEEAPISDVAEALLASLNIAKARA